MKKIQILSIAILCSTLLWTACSKKGADATASTKSVAATPQEAPAAETPPIQGRQAAAPPDENFTKPMKGIGMEAQAVQTGTPDEIMEAAPIPEIVMPPLTKEEEAALRKRIMDAQEKQKKKKG
jgi:PBP1b-binding outer membrane lipoprotein LpoB